MSPTTKFIDMYGHMIFSNFVVVKTFFTLYTWERRTDGYSKNPSSQRPELKD